MSTDGEEHMCRRVILTTGLLTLYLAACLAALSHLAGLWSPFL
jgi:hypothetical protein